MLSASFVFTAVVVLLFVYSLAEAARFNRGGQEQQFLSNAARIVNASVYRNHYFSANVSRVTQLQNTNTTTSNIVLNLLHVHHPSSPFKVKDATVDEEAHAIVEISMAYLRSLIRRINAAYSSLAASQDDQEAQQDELMNKNQPPPAMILPQTATLVGPSGLYFAQLAIGTPHPALNTFIVDTGSDITWMQCFPCQNCFPQDRGPQGPIPYFNPKVSQSYTAVTCPSPLCDWLAVQPFVLCNAGACGFRIQYASQQYSAGSLGQDTFIVGAHFIKGPIFGCSHDSTAANGYGSGLLGVGAGAMSIVQQLRTPLFFCLPHTTNNANLGVIGFGPVGAARSTVQVSLLRSSWHTSGYYLPIIAISVNKIKIPISALKQDGTGGSLLDTGTTLSVLLADSYTAFRDTFRAAVAAKEGYIPPRVSDPIFETCYRSMPNPAKLPSIALHFDNGQSIPMSMANIMLMRPGGHVCLAFSGSIGAVHVPLNVISGVQLAGFLIAIDPISASVSFTPGVCP